MKLLHKVSTIKTELRRRATWHNKCFAALLWLFLLNVFHLLSQYPPCYYSIRRQSTMSCRLFYVALYFTSSQTTLTKLNVKYFSFVNISKIVKTFKIKWKLWKISSSYHIFISRQLNIQIRFKRRYT